jgi:hypothetical protein
VSVAWHRTGSRLGSFLQARARARQQATREQARGQWSGSVLPAAAVGRPGWRRSRRRGRQSYILCERERRTGDATRRGGPAGGYAGVPAVFQQHTCVSRGGSACEQENPEVRGGVSIANQCGPIVSSHKSTTSSNSYSSSIARARPQHIKEAPGPSYRASSNPFTETSSPWQSQPPSSRVTVRNTPPAILHHYNPRQASSSPDEPLQSHLTVLPVPEPCHRRALLTTDPARHGNLLSTRSPPQPRLTQGLP